MVRFHENIKRMKSQYFCIVMYIWFLKLLVVFFCVDSLPTVPPCQNCPTGQPANPGKYYQQKKSKILTKRLPVATIVPAGTNTVIGALVYRGIPSDLRSRPEQSHIFLGLCSPGDYRKSIESPMGEPIFNSIEKVTQFTTL